MMQRQNRVGVTEPVRMLMLEVPPLLRGLLEHAVEAHRDCTLMKDTRSALEMLRQPTLPPDVIVVGLDTASDTTIVPALFAQWPGAQIMTVMESGQTAVLYELRPHQRVLGEMSPAEIVETLHAAYHRDR